MKFSILSLCCVAFATLSSWSFAQEKEAVAQVVGVPATSIPKTGPITATVDLLGGQKINGTLTEATLLPVRLTFGEVQISYADIAGIKLASPEDPSTTIILKNGDSITGATDLKSLSVDTEWGNASIKGSSIVSILFLPDLKWNATMALNGKRWSLVDTKSSPASNAPAASATAPVAPRASSAAPSGTRVVSPN